MSADAVIVGISGAILADAGDMRCAADLLDGVHTGYRASVDEFIDRWGPGLGVGAGWRAPRLPPIHELGERIGALASYLRRAADHYDEADRFAEHSIGEQADGVASTILSMSLAVPVGVLSGHWRQPRVDPRIGGRLTDGAALIAGLGPGPGFTVQALARERAAHPATAAAGECETDGAPPRCLADLAQRVAQLGDRGGNVAIEIVADPDGTRRAIVYLRGTTRWDVGTADPTDLDGNISALAGRPTVYAEGVLEAMRAAGIGADWPVLLVGHSQGGMVAANLSRALAESGEFTVTDILTFGAPFAQMDHPVAAGVQLTALENRSDVVPALDGRRNSRGAGALTVTFDDGDRNGAAHDMEGYRAGAAALDASGSAAALAVTARLSAFTSGSTRSIREYRIRRER